MMHFVNPAGGTLAGLVIKMDGLTYVMQPSKGAYQDGEGVALRKDEVGGLDRHDHHARV